MIQGGEEGIAVAVTRSDRSPGVDIVDPIERRRCQIRTDAPVNPSGACPDRLPFPVETVVAIEATSLRVNVTGHAYVCNAAGERLADFTGEGEQTFPEGTYHLEFPGLIHVYLQFHGEFTLTEEAGDPLVTLAERTDVTVGCRSLHSRPATAVTATSQPRDIAAAISTFGSAIKVTGPDRSFPAYRGHPPTVALGETVSIDSQLKPRITDVAIQVPPRLDRIFPVASLAYYLGMPVEIGDRPAIVGGGIDYDLAGDDGFERTVIRTLQRAFLLDCAVRTEGRSEVNLHLKHELARRLDLSFAELFVGDPVDRLQRYFEVPYEAVADLMPEWRVTAHVDPVPERVETLPFLVADLAALRIADPLPAPDGGQRLPSEIVAHRNGEQSYDSVVTAKEAGSESSMERVWLADGVPAAATKGTQAAYEHRLDRSPRDGPIEIAVVCNAPEMEAEGAVVDDVYGSRAELPFEVTLRRDLEVDELRALLAGDYHFFHYVGHIDADGFRCQDGRLAPGDLSIVGPEAFFLNACQSYEYGLALVRQGAVGGIVTRNDVVNHGAVQIGKTVARLLDCGFPFRAALEIARGRSVMGGEYALVGDGTFSVVQAPSGLPQLYHIRQLEGGDYGLRIQGFGAQPGMGCMWIPYVPDNNAHYLASRKTDEFVLSRAEIAQFLALEPAPILVDGRLTWSDEWTVPDENVTQS